MSAPVTFDRRLLPALISGAVLNPINSSIIAVSLVPIGVAFGAPPSATAWLVSALYLATAVGQPVAGSLIDRHGPRRLFLIAASLVGIAGVMGTFAPNLGVLIAARVLLGFGTCAGYPAAIRLIKDQDGPTGVLTVLSVSTQTIAVIGPPLGGLLIGLGGWRATLAINIPLAVVAFALGWWRLPRTARAPGPRPGLDVAGMLLFAATLVALLLFLLHPGLSDWYLPVIALATGAGFAVRELRAPNPFLDLRLLGGNLPLLMTYARALLAYLISYAFLYGYTQWIEDGRGLSPAHTGLVQLPVFATAIAVSTASSSRLSIRAKLLVGAATQVLACGVLLTLEPSSPIAVLVLLSVVLGVPQGLNSLALQNSVYHQSDSERVGSAAGLLRTFGYLGAIVASAAQGAFYGRSADTPGLHELAVFLLVTAALFLVLVVADRSLRDLGRDHPRDEERA
ncbi:MFS transporter [Saccharopolyspora flava]|uniref:Major Facilitator Superfamily protein n=1 Tax=Saccharopolyspora flava TaxID=95161 RepID=A0A1I6U7Q4_9PSEU|nr:MFS transporter [Saccharopolyspora flava]SFS97378.1 Major Facilitator Superfamily protein [Saccharopolyspora flava]